MDDEFLSLIAGLQNGQTPQIDTPPQQVTMGIQAEERNQVPGLTKSFFGHEYVCESGRSIPKKKE